MSDGKIKRILFLYNPNAGKKKIQSHLSEILEVFDQNGCEVTVRPSHSSQDILDVVLHLSDEYEELVIAGGDGTLDLACTAMMQREKKVPIGYLPMGSTNDFGRSLGLSADPVKAAVSAAAGQAFRCDIGRFNGEHIFVYVAAFGLFTDVSYQTPRDLKNAIGHLAYVLEGAKAVMKIPEYRMQVTADEQVFTGTFIYGMVTNSKSVGGFPVLLNKQETEFNDGLFEVTLVYKPESAKELADLLYGVLNKKYDSPYIVTLHARNVKVVSSTEVAWTMDGEPGGEHRCVEIHNEQEALTLMI